MKTNNISQLHEEAEQLRESEKYLEALQKYQQVLSLYEKSGSKKEFIEALGGMTLTYKHQFLTTGKKEYLILAKSVCLSAFQIAEYYKLDSMLFRIYFWLGEMETISENYAQAIEFYEKALQLYPQDAAEKGEFQYHLGVAQYKNGQKELGMRNILEGIKIIEKNEAQTNLFLINVWLTGAYKTLAELMWNDDKGGAQKYLEKAEKIIMGDVRLIIRKRQVQELKEKLLSS